MDICAALTGAVTLTILFSLYLFGVDGPSEGSFFPGLRRRVSRRDCLSHKHEDMNLNPRHPQKSQVWPQLSLTLPLGRWREEDHWAQPTTQPNQSVRSGFRTRPCVNRYRASVEDSQQEPSPTHTSFPHWKGLSACFERLGLAVFTASSLFPRLCSCSPCKCLQHTYVIARPQQVPLSVLALTWQCMDIVSESIVLCL